MKTILHVIDTTGPGGAETVFIDLATKLPATRYRALVVIRGKGWVYEELRRRGVTPVLLDAKGSFNFSYLRSLIRLVRTENIDLIQAHLLGASVYCSLAGWITRTPVVATFHGSVDIGEHERLKALKFAAINAGAKKIIAVSRDLKRDILARTRLKVEKCQIIYNGIATEDFQRSRSRMLRENFGWDDTHILVGSLGNIRPAKGYDTLLRTAALLKDTDPAFRFVIAGQKDKYGLYEELMTLRSQLDLEDVVKFLGFIDDTAEYLAGLDIFLSTSVSEGLPLSAIQAMAARLPLLATRCGGYEELVTEGVNGLLTEIENPKEIAASLRGLAASPELRTELANSARHHVLETFDSRVMLDAYQSVYDNLLSK